MNDTSPDEEHEALPDWRPRADLDLVQLANALEHIRRSAYRHWVGDGFDPEHMYLISMLAAQALCGELIDAPVDMASSQFKAAAKADRERLLELFDDELHHAATDVAPHEHEFEPDPERPGTDYCVIARCRVLLFTGMGHHPYRELTAPDSSAVAIDEDLAELISALWAEGVETRGCCQGGCCADGAGAIEPAWIVHAAAARDTVAYALAGKPGLRWYEPDADGFVRAEWDTATRCRAWETEHQRRQVGALVVGARVEWNAP